MRRQHHKVEYLTYGKKEGEWREVRMAIDGKVVMPFSVHEADWRAYRNEEERNAFLLRQGLGLLEDHGESRYCN